jgi:hypothetical protein
MSRHSLTQSALAVFTILVAAAACSSPRHTGPATILYSADPAAAENPWPSDRLLAGGKAGTPTGYFSRVLPDAPEFAEPRQFLETAAAALSSNGGYSVYAPIILRLGSSIGTAGIAGIHLYQPAVGVDAAVTVTYSKALQALLVTPNEPLRQKSVYVLAVSDPKLLPSHAFTAALSSDAALGALADGAVAHGVAPATKDLDVVLSFTTQPVIDVLAAIQTRIDGTLGTALLPVFSAGPIPDYTAGYFLSTSAGFTAVMNKAGAKTSDLGAIAQGTWTAWDFRDANGVIVPSFVDGTATPGTTTVDFRLCIPAGTPPAGGWPVVLSSHGLTSDSDEAVKRCYSFAAAGIALVGQTATDHGFRGTFVNFFDFTRLLAVRDEFRQSDAELLQMQQLLVNAKINGIAPFDQLDAGHPHYWGNSLGSLFGGAVIASSSHLGASGLSVPGGRLTRLFEGSAGQLLLALFGAGIGLPSNSDHFPEYLEAFRPLAQWAIDPSDPGALAPYTPVDRRVLIQESLGDVTILNPATDDLRRAFALPVVTAPVDPFTGRGGMWIWDKDQFASTLPADETAHDLYWDLAPMRHQMEDWILSDGANLADPPN